MTKKTDPHLTSQLREEARKLEEYADADGAYPAGTLVSRPNAPSRLFNVRLSDEQFTALAEMAKAKHLPVSTMARAWLLDRLERERHAS